MHDACGVGFIADTRGRPRHAILGHGLTALRRVSHRGAPAELGAVDGCGVLTAIPWPLVDPRSRGARVAAERAVGMIFVREGDRDRAAAIVDRELRNAGAGAI